LVSEQLYHTLSKLFDRSYASVAQVAAKLRALPRKDPDKALYGEMMLRP
jgi:hypothetical protein